VKSIASEYGMAQYVRLSLKKDKLLALDGQPLLEWDRKIIDKFLEGYRYIRAAQEMLGIICCMICAL
jgi:hypothetical protein